MDWKTKIEATQAKPTHAHISLCRLGGCNYRVAVEYRGKSVYVPDPQQPGKVYRINATTFCSTDEQVNDGQVRGTWFIRKWDDRAAREMESERNWQT